MLYIALEQWLAWSALMSIALSLYWLYLSLTMGIGTDKLDVALGVLLNPFGSIAVLTACIINKRLPSESIWIMLYIGAPALTFYFKYWMIING